MNRIHFEVPGNPKSQKRHRPHVRAHGKGKYHVWSDDPSESDKADFLALCRDHAPKTPIGGAVILYMVFWMPIPKSATKRFREEVACIDYLDYLPIDVSKHARHNPTLFSILHVKRPDESNFQKMVEDALDGIYWKDDSQVQIGGAFKGYSHRPRTEVEVIY